jgi:hypothetical protein
MRSRAILSSVSFSTIALAAALTFQACTDSQSTGVDADPLVLARGGGAAENPSVDATDPTEAPRGTTLDVRVIGTNFDDGSTVTFKLGGKPTKKVKTNSTGYVSDEELVANITIDVDADTALYDVEVMTSRKRRGIGTELFSVKLSSDDYQFEYASEIGQFGSDCVKKKEAEHGKTYWCYGEMPTFALRVVNPEGSPATSGTVTFSRCVDSRDGSVQPWYKCGVLQRGGSKRFYGGVYFGVAAVDDDGIAALNLGAEWVEDSTVWGTHWEYYTVDGRKQPEVSIKWRDLAYVGHSNPYIPQ